VDSEGAGVTSVGGEGTTIFEEEEEGRREKEKEAYEDVIVLDSRKIEDGDTSLC